MPNPPILGFAAAPENPLLEWCGNSIAVLVGSVINASTTFSKPVLNFQKAVGGNTQEAMNLSFATTPKGDIQTASHQHVIVFAWEGRNSIAVNGDTGSAALTAMQTFVTNTLALASSLGMNIAVVVGTMLPSTGVNETDRTTYNTGIRALTNGTTVFVADFASDPTMGAAGANLNATYYSDGIHPTNPTGINVLLPYAVAAVNQAITAIGA